MMSPVNAATELQPNDPGHDLGQPTPVPPGADQVALSPAPTSTTQLPADAGREPIQAAPVEPQADVVAAEPTTTLPEPTAAPDAAETAQEVLPDTVAMVDTHTAPDALLPATGADSWAVLLLGLLLVLAGAYSQLKAKGWGSAATA